MAVIRSHHAFLPGTPGPPGLPHLSRQGSISLAGRGTSSPQRRQRKSAIARLRKQALLHSVKTRPMPRAAPIWCRNIIGLRKTHAKSVHRTSAALFLALFPEQYCARTTLLAAAFGGLGVSYAQTPTAYPPSNTTTPTPVGNLAPCAQVSVFLSKLPDGHTPLIPAEVAYACLSTVPVDVQGNQLLIEQLKVFLQWNSNTAYLKNPPRQFGYKEKAVDIMGGLDIISRGIKNGLYMSEYAAQIAIGNLLNRGYDNHLYYSADIGDIFIFERPIGLVSVSTDGVALPELYVYDDLNATANGATFTPSVVKTIDDVDASTWLGLQAEAQAFHDADARYNTLFPQQASGSISGLNLGGFKVPTTYVGPTTNITFANGTTLGLENLAVINAASFEGVDSGETFFSRFCTGPKAPEPTPTPSGTPEAPSSTPAPPTPTPTNYPEPVVYDAVGLTIGGYYLDGAGYEDVAVLSIPSFESKLGVGTFQNVTRDFLADAKSKGKSKLVVDLRQNGGGLVYAGFEVFKQLFPTIEPYGASRFRAQDAWHIIGEGVTIYRENVTLQQALNETNSTLFNYAATGMLSDFDYTQNLDINNKNFTSFNEFYGPHTVYNDQFTTTRRPNFDIQNVGVTLTGTGDLSNVTAQPFTADNIVILQDGQCSSTCSIFSLLMSSQGHVESIAIGGLPVAAPMQAVSGTKGSRVLEFYTINDFALKFMEIVTSLHEETAAKLNATVIGTLAYPSQLAQRLAYRSGKPVGSINAEDTLLKNDTTETPSEFHYEAADCKIFYTAKQILDVTEVWKTVADTKWGNKKCVANSTGDPTSESVVYNSTTPETTNNNAAVRGASVSMFAAVGVVLALFL
ncbi:uncharacterized protein BDZ99DRAFT_497434 [Mytilinidion resinicola]|uniref:Tail specific protease domain-containing protein n=1 Tax=Mytilinidion resinicola TaxID=574789 RepID=A0A6A6YV01_9PEZI|nr:uncharacterized protein BDZ99DRAFT_497434 [Mytilinidion resinicola]KAF2811787.1 hypothetical protein BDZ99DRAFT_497434 [Mytilinidion resinicola]